MKKISNPDILSGMLKVINPKMCISNSHYICGSGLSLFASLGKIENCLTSITNKCKCIRNKPIN